jgi:predicted nucleic acid-binding protein
MEQRYLIDTNVISHLFADKLPTNGKVFVSTVINTEFIISVVVEIEVLTYHDLPNKMPLIEEFISLATILPLNNEITKKAIELRRKYRKLALADAIIATTALVNQLVIITHNEKDFLNIKGLKLDNPFNL